MLWGAVSGPGITRRPASRRRPCGCDARPCGPHATTGTPRRAEKEGAGFGSGIKPGHPPVLARAAPDRRLSFLCCYWPRFVRPSFGDPAAPGGPHLRNRSDRDTIPRAAPGCLRGVPQPLVVQTRETGKRASPLLRQSPGLVGCAARFNRLRSDRGFHPMTCVGTKPGQPRNVSNYSNTACCNPSRDLRCLAEMLLEVPPPQRAFCTVRATPLAPAGVSRATLTRRVMRMN